MFGYVIANKEALSEQQLERYRGCYCGLCRALKERHGAASRLTLTYDMTFLILLLSSMYEPEETCGEARCIAHPAKPQKFWRNEISDYAADMNLALAYFNCMDDWQDDRNLLKRAEAGVFRGDYLRIKESYPEKCAAIENELRELAAIEKRGEQNPDRGARSFGRVMGEVFSYKADRVWGPRLRDFGQELGEFIYIMDAVLDLEKDLKKGEYNPVATLAAERSEEELRSILTMLIGEAAAKFEQLPLVQDVDILRNILYSGVWLRYNAEQEKKTKGGTAGE